MNSIVQPTHSSSASPAALSTEWAEAAKHVGPEAWWGALPRPDRLKLRAVQASFATRPRCEDDNPAELIALAGELAGAGEKDAALELLVTACSLLWMAGGRVVDGPQRAAAGMVLTAVGPCDPADARVQAVEGVIGRFSSAPRRRGGTELDLVRHHDVLGSAGLAALARGEASRACVLLDQSISDARRTGRTGLLAHLCALRARAAIALGDWHAAASAAIEGGAAATSSRQPLWLAHTNVALATVHAVRGETELAWRLASQAEVDAGGAVRDSAAFARAVALLSDEQHSEACHVLRSLVRRERSGETRWDTAVLLGYLAEAVVHERTGSGSESGQIADLLSRVRWQATVPVVSNALYIRALFSDEPEALEAFRSARQAASESSPWLAARIDLAHGIWLRRHRRTTQARPLLQAAAHTFDSFEARTWAERARRELRAGTMSSSPLDRQLTARERQITLLVADGLTNREIGERVFLSPRTIGAHLYRIFPKLGITSRAQLAARAHELLGAGTWESEAEDAA